MIRAFLRLIAPKFDAPKGDARKGDARKGDARKGDASKLPVVSLASLLTTEPSVRLCKLAFRDGNVSPLEILAISSLVAELAPRLAFEIGTFNGNTTLQIAANLALGGKVFTLDLPPVDTVATQKQVDGEDLKYMELAKTVGRRFYGTPEAASITEVFGDSAVFDFAGTLGGQKLDFAFIDGAHSFDYVKSDTERILKLIRPGGLVLWHDYQPFWTGVCDYLNGRSDLPIAHIEGTTIAVLRVL